MFFALCLDPLFLLGELFELLMYVAALCSLPVLAALAYAKWAGARRERLTDEYFAPLKRQAHVRAETDGRAQGGLNLQPEGGQPRRPRAARRGVLRGRARRGRRGLREADGGAGRRRALAREATAGGATDVVVRGGDGTVHEAIQGLAGTRARVLVWPAGTANVLAKQLGLPRDAAEAAESSRADARARITLGAATSERTGARRYFFMMAGVGLDASVVRQRAAASEAAGGRGGLLVRGARAPRALGAARVHGRGRGRAPERDLRGGRQSAVVRRRPRHHAARAARLRRVRGLRHRHAEPPALPAPARPRDARRRARRGHARPRLPPRRAPALRQAKASTCRPTAN